MNKLKSILGYILIKVLNFKGEKKEFSKFQKQKNSKQLPTRKPNCRVLQTTKDSGVMSSKV